MKKTVQEKIARAVRNDDIVSLLRGTKEYKIELHQWIGGIAPTDWTVVMQGMHKLNLSHPEYEIPKKLREALYHLVSVTNEDVLAALAVIYIQLLYENNGRASFKLDGMEVIIEEVRQILQKKRESAGTFSKNAVWEEIERYLTLLECKFGL